MICSFDLLTKYHFIIFDSFSLFSMFVLFVLALYTQLERFIDFMEINHVRFWISQNVFIVRQAIQIPLVVFLWRLFNKEHVNRCGTNLPYTSIKHIGNTLMQIQYRLVVWHRQIRAIYNIMLRSIFAPINHVFHSAHHQLNINNRLASIDVMNSFQSQWMRSIYLNGLRHNNLIDFITFNVANETVNRIKKKIFRNVVQQIIDEYYYKEYTNKISNFDKQFQIISIHGWKLSTLDSIFFNKSSVHLWLKWKFSYSPTIFHFSIVNIGLFQNGAYFLYDIFDCLSSIT